MQSNIVQFVDCDEAHTFVIMEFVANGTIAGQHARRNFSPQEVETFMHGTLDALSFLHSYSMIHNDVKPENILVHAREGGKVHIKLADFGLAQDKSIVNVPCGTPYYGAPEMFILLAKMTGKIDVWALGVIALKYLHGIPAVRTQNNSLMQFHPQSAYANGWNSLIQKGHEDFLKANRHDPVVPEGIVLLIAAMLSHDPDTRPSSSMALGVLRKIYKPDYFKLPDPSSEIYATGSKRQRGNDNHQTRIAPALANPHDRNAAKFYFKDIAVDNIWVTRLEPCLIVNMLDIIKYAAKTFDRRLFEGKDGDLPDFRKWYIRRPGSRRYFEFYVRVDIAISYCKQWNIHSDLQRALHEMLEDRRRQNLEDDPRCQLVDAVGDQWYIVITHSHRMVLVRRSDGHIHSASLQMAYAKQTLEKEHFEMERCVSVLDAQKMVEMTPIDLESFRVIHHFCTKVKKQQ